MTLKELFLTLRNQDPEIHIYHAKGSFPYEVSDRVGAVFCFPTTAKISDVLEGIKRVLTDDNRDMPVCLIRKLKTR
jgi:hypothetical protein